MNTNENGFLQIWIMALLKSNLEQIFTFIDVKTLKKQQGDPRFVNEMFFSYRCKIVPGLYVSTGSQ
jgi:hypothetical protein